MFGGKHDSLKMQCLEDVDCTPEKAKDMLLTALGKMPRHRTKALMHTFTLVTATSPAMLSARGFMPVWVTNAPNAGTLMP
jgi:hypothetical protein